MKIENRFCDLLNDVNGRYLNPSSPHLEVGARLAIVSGQAFWNHGIKNLLAS